MAPDQQQPEQKIVLGFPVRPEGGGGAVAGGRQHWYELAEEIHGAFADIDRVIASMQWSGDGRRAFDAAWSQFSGHGTEAAQHSQEMGDHLLKLGHQIDDAQNQWDMAMAAMVASTAIGIGLTFVTFGISDAVAEGAVAAAVGTMEAVCTALEISLEAAVQVMIAAIRIGVQLAVKFTWQFGIGVVTEETANAVQGQGLDHVSLLQAAEFAGISLMIPGAASRITIRRAGPASAEEFASESTAAKEAVSAGAWRLAGRADPLARAAELVPTTTGFHDVVVHGTPTGFAVLRNGNWVTLDHRSIASFLKSNGYQGGPVRLISCGTGSLDTGAAQNLANKLGAEVMAPTDTLWILPDGRMTIGLQPRANTGSWRHFYPGAKP
jgi:hypothetical protein